MEFWIQPVGKCETCRVEESNWRKKNRGNRAQKEREYQQKNWDKRCVMHSKCADRKYKREFDSQEYITAKRLRTLRMLQKNRCFYCDVELQIKNRKRPNGLSIERLQNDRPHCSDNVVIACHRCNCKRMNRLNPYSNLEVFYKIWKNYRSIEKNPDNTFDASPTLKATVA